MKRFHRQPASCSSGCGLDSALILHSTHALRAGRCRVLLLTRARSARRMALSAFLPGSSRRARTTDLKSPARQHEESPSAESGTANGWLASKTRSQTAVTTWATPPPMSSSLSERSAAGRVCTRAGHVTSASAVCVVREWRRGATRLSEKEAPGGELLQLSTSVYGTRPRRKAV